MHIKEPSVMFISVTFQIRNKNDAFHKNVLSSESWST